MKKLIILPSLAIAFLLPVLTEAHEDAEALEVGPHNVSQLPKGKEADGIIGDFILRNDRIEAVISHNANLRRANMSTFYGANGVTPGCLYDLTLRGSGNDQITIFSPSAQQGTVSYVRIIPETPEGQAAVETVITAAKNNGIYKRHEYRIHDHQQGLVITTQIRNESGEKKTIKTTDRWTTVNRVGVVDGITIGNAIDPADKAGYAYSWIDNDEFNKPSAEVELASGDEIVYARFLAVGRSPVDAFGVVAEQRGSVGTLAGWLRDSHGYGIGSGQVNVLLGDHQFPAYPNDEGFFRVSLREGSYSVAIRDTGRETIKQTIDIKAGNETKLNTSLSADAAVEFKIRDELGRSVPCKAQFIGIYGTKTPNLGPQNRAHGCVDQYHSEKGNFRVQLPPGEYKIIVTYGIEYSHLEKEIRVKKDETETFAGTLKRLVHTPGWVSSDFHNHSTPSGDNTCGTDDRIINLAAEHIEFAPTTEHNRFYDWRPHIEKLGLSEYVGTVSGIEVTGSGAHFNAFPYTPVPYTQDWGAPVWNKDPRLTAITLRGYQGYRADRWIQINHPDLVENFYDRNGDGQIDGGFLGLGELIEGFETQNGNSANILSKAPYRIYKNRDGKESVGYVREFIWLQMLNQGIPVWAQAVSDAHSVYGNGVGGWRCYVQSSTDHPGQLNWQELSRASKSGRIILTSGPYLEVSTVDGILPGGHASATDSVELKVRVQCTDWIDIDRIQILVNGEQRPDVNFTRASHPDWFQDGVVKFDRIIKVPVQQDSHIIVVAYGENFDLETGFGTSPQSGLRPCAYNNPIFVDVDGGGFTANRDTLGFDLPSAQSDVEHVKAMLQSSLAE